MKQVLQRTRTGAAGTEDTDTDRGMVKVGECLMGRAGPKVYLM